LHQMMLQQQQQQHQQQQLRIPSPLNGGKLIVRLTVLEQIAKRRILIHNIRGWTLLHIHYKLDYMKTVHH
jgi:hypothetical protein